MNSEIDDLIREAVREQERLAVPADRIRAALPTRAAGYARRRRTVAGLTAMTAAAAAVAVAVVLPTVLREPDGGGGVATPPTVTGTQDPADPGLGSVPLRFTPTWLPEGMVERSRFVPVIDTPAAKSGLIRVWSREPLDRESGFVADTPHIGLYAWTARPDPGASHAPPVALDENGRRARGGATVGDVDINGRPGRYYGAGKVTWQIDDRTELNLVAPETGLSKEDLLRIARSVRPDSAALRSPLRLGWLPDGLAVQDLTVAGNSATEWEARMVAERKATPDALATRFVSVELGPAAGEDPGSGERVEIDGRSARLTRVDVELTTRPGYRAKWALVVELDAGRRLTVYGGVVPHAGQAPAPTREDMIRIAEHVELAEPDLTWFPR